MTVRLEIGDCTQVLPRLAAEGLQVDAVVSDPPYHLASIVKRFGATDSVAPSSNGATGVYKRAAKGFMGQQWDGGDVAFQADTWRAVMAVMKPGAHLVAFAATRNYQRMACAIEDAGLQLGDADGMRDMILNLRATSSLWDSFLESLTIDQADAFVLALGEASPAMLAWLYGSGFPKSHNVAAFTSLDTRRLFDGWGTALKPAFEPIVLARKPLASATIAANVLDHGTGALHIDACRIDVADGSQDLPRWPANIVHDGSADVLAAFPSARGQRAPVTGKERTPTTTNIYGAFGARATAQPRTDDGSAARFFYSAKADGKDRIGSKHPTVKPVDLMRWLVRLVTPNGGTVLDPFAGSGTTGQAAQFEGCDAVLIEANPTYGEDIRRRFHRIAGTDTPLFADKSPRVAADTCD